MSEGGLGGFWGAGGVLGRALGSRIQITFLIFLERLWGLILGALGFNFLIFTVSFRKWLRIIVFLSFWRRIA